MFVRVKRGKKEVTPVPVSSTIDKDTRRKRLLSVPRALVLFHTVVPAVILKVTVASPESCHRSTDPPFTGGRFQFMVLLCLQILTCRTGAMCEP